MDLASLITAHKRGRSYRKLADDCGGRPTHQRLQQLGSGAVKEWMEADSIAGLAQGLGVSHRAVVLALAESMGLDVRGSPLDQYMPATVDELREDQREAIGQLVRTMVPPAAEATHELHLTVVPTAARRTQDATKLRPDPGADEDSQDHYQGEGDTP